jgi:hypothetical protein
LLALLPIDVRVTDAYFVAAHVHTIMAGGSVSVPRRDHVHRDVFEHPARGRGPIRGFPHRSPDEPDAPHSQGEQAQGDLARQSVPTAYFTGAAGGCGRGNRRVAARARCGAQWGNAAAQ